jgi:tetratricopeptide (TPR) repeat protein
MNNISRLTALLAIFLIFVVAGQFAYADSMKYSKEQADDFFQKGEWQKAIEAYQQVTAENPDDAGAWFHLGYAYQAVGEYDKAIPAYEKADQAGYMPTVVRYNLACAFALKGNKSGAYAWLDKALEAGFGNTKLLKEDSDLESLRSDAKFAGYIEKAEHNSSPCEYDPDCRKFDFWLGEWDVYNPAGQMVGTSKIQKLLNGCMILENWSGTLGTEGKSMNYYDPHAGTWKQNWVSAQGNIIEYEGEYKNGAMHFSGVSVDKSGKTELSEMTMTPNEDGTVTQLIKHSTDNGETWEIWFKGIYKPKEEITTSQKQH